VISAAELDNYQFPAADARLLLEIANHPGIVDVSLMVFHLGAPGVPPAGLRIHLSRNFMERWRLAGPVGKRKSELAGGTPALPGPRGRFPRFTPSRKSLQ